MHFKLLNERQDSFDHRKDIVTYLRKIRDNETKNSIRKDYDNLPNDFKYKKPAGMEIVNVSDDFTTGDVIYKPNNSVYHWSWFKDGVPRVGGPNKPLENRWDTYYDKGEEEKEDSYSVYDFVADRLFGIGFNKSHYRNKIKFLSNFVVDIVSSKDNFKKSLFYPAGSGDLLLNTLDDRRVFTDGNDIAIKYKDERENTLAKKIADVLKLRYIEKPLKHNEDFPLVGVIKIPDNISEMDIEDYTKKYNIDLNKYLEDPKTLGIR